MCARVHSIKRSFLYVFFFDGRAIIERKKNVLYFVCENINGKFYLFDYFVRCTNVYYLSINFLSTINQSKRSRNFGRKYFFFNDFSSYYFRWFDSDGSECSLRIGNSSSDLSMLTVCNISGSFSWIKKVFLVIFRFEVCCFFSFLCLESVCQPQCFHYELR